MADQEKQQQLKVVCRSRGIILTPQRQAIMRALTARRDHPTADQLYDDLSSQMPGMSRTTVYRVLETFVNLGLVRKVDSRASKAHFDADVSRHPHLVCLGCGKVCDFQDRDFGLLRPPTMTDDGFEIVDYSVTLVGYCRQCRHHEKTPQD